MKDAIDLLQGHYIVSVSRDMAPSSQKGGLEAIAVSKKSLLDRSLRHLFDFITIIKSTLIINIFSFPDV